LVLKGYNDDELCAIATLKFHQDSKAEIEKIIWKHDHHRTGSDKEFAFVIGSGILNFIDRRGVREVFSTDKANKYILKLLKFEYDEELDKFILDLTDYFEPNCLKRGAGD